MSLNQYLDGTTMEVLRLGASGEHERLTPMSGTLRQPPSRPSKDERRDPSQPIYDLAQTSEFQTRQSTAHTAESVSRSMAVFAHEVRTPLATLNATLEVLCDDPSIDADELRQLVERMQRGAIWISRLVDNFSTWSKICDGELALQQSPTVVRDWIEHAIALVQPIADRREQSILLTCPRPAPLVYGDALRLGQVIVNLLTNASRYGAWADTIVVSVIDDDDFVSIRVSDHGDGVLPEERDRIFERLVRGTQAGDRHVEGEGLGLHIVRDIIERHGGTISVDSLVGRGSTFSIRLPAMPAPLFHQYDAHQESDVRK